MTYLFPKILRAYGLAYMPIYCPKKKQLFLVSEDLWNKIMFRLPYKRSKINVKHKNIKQFKFVHDIHGSKFIYLSPIRWQYLRHFKFIVQKPEDNPRANLTKTICIESCWLLNRFQCFSVKKYGNYYIRKWIIWFSKKPIGVVRIKVGYFSETLPINWYKF